MQRVLWWIAFALFVAIVVLGIFAISAVIASNPVTAAFFLGFLGFWLFANRLIFGFGGIANAAKAFIDGQLPDKAELAKKVAKTQELAQLQKLEELSVVALLGMWRNALEPFKYAYYLGFFLTFLLAVLFELNIISSIVFGPVAEAVMLGAAIPTLLVWGLELLADYYLAKAAVKAVEELQSQEQPQKGQEEQNK
ncbi:hypothetical protein [Thermovibrio ammonificans]|uniref:Transmembrane protein n=1 Tax=Thermovibrio ammonificans (strain DSM 15698 / JCM 12110 / HB-1) TaxID=648996 RepID=E8T678_THEA1|nr:hypothetical protein [Thermovibrio ammonificans]ADU96662.1 hypothetical protein Theam_0694 [Thermovibrio ammonificans HB-1]